MGLFTKKQHYYTEKIGDVEVYISPVHVKNEYSIAKLLKKGQIEVVKGESLHSTGIKLKGKTNIFSFFIDNTGKLQLIKSKEIIEESYSNGMLLVLQTEKVQAYIVGNFKIIEKNVRWTGDIVQAIGKKFLIPNPKPQHAGRNDRGVYSMKNFIYEIIIDGDIVDNYRTIRKIKPEEWIVYDDHLFLHTKNKSYLLTGLDDDNNLLFFPSIEALKRVYEEETRILLIKINGMSVGLVGNYVHEGRKIVYDTVLIHSIDNVHPPSNSMM